MLGLKKRVRVKKGFKDAGHEFNVNFIRPTTSRKNKYYNPSGYFVYFKNHENVIEDIRFAHEVEEVKI